MTSKNLFFNLFREDIKQRVWVFAVIFLVFLFKLPINALLELERILNPSGIMNLEEAYQDFATIANNSYVGVLYVATIFAAIVAGFSGFYYLYSRSKIDLYHSIPVKREKLFIVTYLNGVLVFVIPYLINLLLYFIIGAANHLLRINTVKEAVATFGVNVLGFLFLYSIILVAIMMTGRLFLGFLGTLVFMFYGTVLLTLRSEIYSGFYKTFYETSQQDYYSGLSPVLAYQKLYTLVGHPTFGRWLIGILVVTIFCTILSLWLYKIRPSEAAGQAMAFRKTKSVIKILIAIPTAIMGGLLFHGMTYSESFGWIVFGSVFTGFLAHGIIEIIYNMDFKCIVKHKLQMLFCIVAAILLVGVAKIDLFQYDNYLPKQDKIASMSVSLDNLDPMYIYYDFDKDFENYGYYSSVSTQDYRLSHMELKNLSPVYQLAEYAVKNNNDESVYNDMDNQTHYTRLVLKYNLKSGATKYREYIVKVEDILGYADQISKEESYQEGVYQILTMDKSIIHSVNYINNIEGVESTLPLSEDEKQEFLSIYSNELKTFSPSKSVLTLPIAQLIMVLGDNNNYMTQEYYVYPEFTQTIAYMEKKGVKLNEEIDTTNVEKIVINNFEGVEKSKELEMKGNYTLATGKEIEITSKEEIEAICNALLPSRFVDNFKGSYNIAQYLDITVYYKDAQNSVNSVVLNLDKIPDDLKRKIGY